MSVVNNLVRLALEQLFCIILLKAVGSLRQESCKGGFEMKYTLGIKRYPSAFEAKVTNPLEHRDNKGPRFIFKILTSNGICIIERLNG